MTWRPDYCTADQLAAFLNIPTGDEADAAELATAITAASRAIDKFCHRQFGQVTATETRSYPGRWSRTRNAWIVSIDDLPASTGLIVSIGGTVVTGWTLGPLNAVQTGMVFTELVFGPTVTTVPSCDGATVDCATNLWGWTGVPTTVLQASKIQGGRFHKRRDALFGVAGSPADGSEVRLLDKIDPDVAVMLAIYQRRWWAA